MLTLVNSEVDCGRNCVCSHSAMKCTGTHITTPPNKITDVQIINTDFEELKTEFTRDPAAWSRIISLSLHSKKSTSLPNGTFKGLDSLAFLKVQGEDLEYTDLDTFSGLDNLTTLELTYNGYLYTNTVITSLSHKPIVLPNLEILNISFNGRKHFISGITHGFLGKAIAEGRHIRTLDISGISFDRFNISDCYPLCENGLQHVYARGTSISNLDFNHEPNETCKYLQTFDISEIKVGNGMYDYFLLLFTIPCKFFLLLKSVKTLMLDRIIPYDINITSTHLKFSECPFQFEHVSLSGNKLRHLNFSYSFHNVTMASLKFLDLSYNGLEYVSPRVLLHSTGLTCFNISDNNLYKMQRDNIEDFTKLLNAQIKLKEVVLSGNLLFDLPFTFFWNNTELIIIDLSNNRLGSIRFDVSRMKHLEVLNLSSNRIMILDDSTVSVLRSLQIVDVDLSNNPLTCECNTLDTDFFNWLSTQRQKQLMKNVYCINDNTKYQLFTSNHVRDLRHTCDIQRLTPIFASVPPVIVFLISAATALFVIRRRRRLKQLAFDQIIIKIRKNELPYEFLTFLCFASDDKELVDTNVYQNMNTTFSEIIGVDNNFVCKGDLSYRPGFHIMDETARCIDKCAVVVAAVSNKSCQRHWCEKEIMHGYNIGKPIVLILLEKIDKTLMPPIVARSFNTFVHAALITDNNEVRLEPSWANLCKSIIELAGKENDVRERDVEIDKEDMHEFNLQNL